MIDLAQPDVDALIYAVEIDGRRWPLDRVQGREGCSEVRRFAIELSIPWQEPLDPEAVTGKDAMLVLRRARDERSISCVVSEARRSPAHRAAAGGARVELVLEARLAWLAHRIDQRVFRDRDVPTIVTEVCAAVGVTVKRRLSAGYRVRPYTVQHGEADLDFVRRLLEDEGIHFTTLDDDTVVLGDAVAAWQPAADLPVRQRTGLDQGRDGAFDLGLGGALVPAAVTARDFDFERPGLEIAGTASVPGAAPEATPWYAYPAGCTTPGEAHRKAQLLAEAFAGEVDVLRGRAFAAWLRPGLAVRLTDAPDGIEEGPWAVLRVEHHWARGAAGFAVAFEALPEGRTFRPVPRTPLPRAPGLQIGFVTGPGGADIHTEAWGRVKVHFPWDRLQARDDRCSDWVPTLQDHTGQSSAIPRTGWEVLVDFVEGDPDRPVILGRLYNGADPHFAVLPSNKAWTTLRSLTSPRAQEGRTGENLITFDDAASAQRILMHAERDRVVVVGHDRSTETRQRDSRVVQRDEALVVGGDRTLEVGSDRSVNVGGPQTVTIGATRRVDVAGAASETVGQDRSVRIGGALLRRIGQSDTTNVQRDQRERVGAVALEASVRESTVSADQVSLTAVGGAAIHVVRGPFSQGAGEARVETIAGVLVTKARELVATRAGTSRTTLVGGSMTIAAGESVLLSGQQELAVSAASAALTAGAKLTLKVKDSTLVVEKGLIALDAKRIVVSTQDRNSLAAARSKQNE